MAGPRLLLLNSLAPIQKIMQRLGNPEPRITEALVREVMLKIQVGDILLSREEWKLTNPFVPGLLGHAAIYYGSQLVVEAVAPEVRTDFLERWLYQKDSVVVVRPVGLTQDDRELAARIAYAEKGKDYDYGFVPTAKAFYCSELITYAYAMATGDAFEFYPRKTFGVKTVLPQDFYDAVKDGKFEIIAQEFNL